MNDKAPEEMTEAEEAEYLYAHRDDPDLAGEEVPYTPPRGARVAVRLSFDEERRIRQAAEEAGMSVSAFLRQAALTAAARRVTDIERLRRDLDEARSRLDDAWQALA
jgi:uncharacterized protein (DUF1778 family)